MAININTPVYNTYHSKPLSNIGKPINNLTANDVPFTENSVTQITNINRQNNNLSPNYMRQVYSNHLAPSNGSTSESFLKARASLSSNFRHNEKTIRYQMISEINQKLYKMQKKIDLYI